uniref:Uncharacterized protein n=1 Tax=Glossina brevipalpis TaxID=37001 RepID=A0A1A9W4T7_9MUSC
MGWTLSRAFACFGAKYSLIIFVGTIGCCGVTEEIVFLGALVCDADVCEIDSIGYTNDGEGRGLVVVTTYAVFVVMCGKAVVDCESDGEYSLFSFCCTTEFVLHTSVQMAVELQNWQLLVSSARILLKLTEVLEDWRFSYLGTSGVGTSSNDFVRWNLGTSYLGAPSRAASYLGNTCSESLNFDIVNCDLGVLYLDTLVSGRFFSALPSLPLSQFKF